MRDYISAKFLLAQPPGPTVIPEGFKITRCTAKVATGARKPKTGLAPGLMSSAAQGEVYHGAKQRLHNASR